VPEILIPVSSSILDSSLAAPHWRVGRANSNRSFGEAPNKGMRDQKGSSNVFLRKRWLVNRLATSSFF